MASNKNTSKLSIKDRRDNKIQKTWENWVNQKSRKCLQSPRFSPQIPHSFHSKVDFFPHPLHTFSTPFDWFSTAPTKESHFSTAIAAKPLSAKKRLFTCKI
jgi:hypothetical protein